MKPLYENYIRSALESPTGRAVIACIDRVEARSTAQAIGLVRRHKGYKVTIRQRGSVVTVER